MTCAICKREIFGPAVPVDLNDHKGQQSAHARCGEDFPSFVVQGPQPAPPPRRPRPNLGRVFCGRCRKMCREDWAVVGELAFHPGCVSGNAAAPSAASRP